MKKKVKQKQQTKGGGGCDTDEVNHAGCREKEGEGKKRGCDGDRPSAWSDSPLLRPNPPHRLGVRV